MFCFNIPISTVNNPAQVQTSINKQMNVPVKDVNRLTVMTSTIVINSNINEV